MFCLQSGGSVQLDSALPYIFLSLLLQTLREQGRTKDGRETGVEVVCEGCPVPHDSTNKGNWQSTATGLLAPSRFSEVLLPWKAISFNQGFFQYPLPYEFAEHSDSDIWWAFIRMPTIPICPISSHFTHSLTPISIQILSLKSMFIRGLHANLGACTKYYSEGPFL